MVKILHHMGYLVLLCLLGAALQEFPIQASTINWPIKDIVLIPGAPVIHTKRGLSLICEAPFVDSKNRLFVPICLFIEELEAVITYTDSKVILSLNDRVVTLDSSQYIVVANEEIDYMNSSNYLSDCSMFFPIRFVAERLGYTVQYCDGVILVGKMATELTPINALIYSQEIQQRWVSIESGWSVQHINMAEMNSSVYPGSFFWRDLGDGSCALYQSHHVDADMALLIIEDLLYESYSHPEFSMFVKCTEFRSYPEGYYALLHIGGTTTGYECLYRFNSDDGAKLLYSGHIGFYDVSGEYAYYLESTPFTVGTIYRVHIPSVLSGVAYIHQRVGRDTFFYGDDYSENPDGTRSGGVGILGFCVDDNYIYASGFSFSETPYQIVLYKIELATMTHVQLATQKAKCPQLFSKWVLFLDRSNLYKINRDGGASECLASGVRSICCKKNRVYILYEYSTDGSQPFWQELLINE